MAQNGTPMERHCDCCSRRYTYHLKMSTPEKTTLFCPSCRNFMIYNTVTETYENMKGKIKRKKPIEKILQEKVCCICNKIFFTNNYSKQRCDLCIEISKEKLKENKILKNIKINETLGKNRLKAKKQYERNIGSHHVWARHVINSHVKRGHVILIDIDKLTKLAKDTTHCPICGTKLSYNGSLEKEAGQASMDRIKNSVWYGEDGIGIICKRCNTIKGNVPFNKFKRVISGWAKYIKKVDKKYNPLSTNG